MNQNQNKTNDPKLEKEMNFYVPVGAIVVEVEGSEIPSYTIVMLGGED